MAALKDKITNALNEARILILGAHVLLGFQFRSVFEQGFESLPEHTKSLKLAALALMIIAVALLMTPSAYHRIANEGEDTKDMHSITSVFITLALMPFALGLGIDFFVATEKLFGTAIGAMSGVAASLVALFFWYGLELFAKGKPARKGEQSMSKKEQASTGTRLKDKIKHVLTEARTVLPGAQALLGFQFATMLVESFDKLPDSSKYIHLASLALVALSTVLLMTPAAYHRIVEEGEDTKHFHNFSSRVLLAAMIPLALGICGDFFVVARKISDSVSFSLIASIVLMAIFFGLWFGFTAYRREQREEILERHRRQEAAD
ncbi:MAG TPA: DUF6328 family protein [Blastocatellia bacterium]|nr:DUF6328 family protein [Blastocatellia bacterium]